MKSHKILDMRFSRKTKNKGLFAQCSSKPCSKSSSRHIFAPQNWLEALPRKIHRKPQVGGLLIGVTLYIIGIVCANIANVFKDIVLFFRTYPSFHLAMFGLTFVFCMYGYGAERIRRLLLKLDPCFEPSNEMKSRGETYLTFLEKSYALIVNNKYSLIFGTVWFLFIVWRVYVHYPQPIAGFSSQPFVPHGYDLFEYYILCIFLLVMLILGTGCWNIVSACFSFKKMDLLILPERLTEIKKLTSYVLWMVGAWYICVATSAPVLMLFSPQEDVFALNWLVIFNPISLIQIFFGVLIFIFPQLAFHRAVVRKKDEQTLELEKLYEKYYNQLVKTHEKKVTNESFKLSILLTSTSTEIERIKKKKEWPIDFSVIIKLAGSSVASAVLTTVIQYAFAN